MNNKPIQIELSLDIMFHSVNCYLIPGEQLTLVDCGFDTDKNWLLFQEKLAENNYEVRDIEQIIITHEHRDHIGLLPRILEQSNAMVLAPKMIEGWFTRPQEMRAKKLNFTKKNYKNLGFSKELYERSIKAIEQFGRYSIIENTDNFIYFREGDVVKIGEAVWEVLNTPGHCPTQFVFIQKEEKRIFSGDMLLPIAPMPIVTEDPKNPGKPIRALSNLLNSFERLKAYDFQHVYPGHGPIFTNANAIIDKQLKRIQERKAECFKYYQEGFTSVYTIHQKMYPNHQVPPNFSGIHMVLGYLDLLKEEGKI